MNNNKQKVILDFYKENNNYVLKTSDNSNIFTKGELDKILLETVDRIKQFADINPNIKIKNVIIDNVYHSLVSCSEKYANIVSENFYKTYKNVKKNFKHSSSQKNLVDLISFKLIKNSCMITSSFFDAAITSNIFSSLLARLDIWRLVTEVEYLYKIKTGEKNSPLVQTEINDLIQIKCPVNKLYIIIDCFDDVIDDMSFEVYLKMLEENNYDIEKESLYSKNLSKDNICILNILSLLKSKISSYTYILIKNILMGTCYRYISLYKLKRILNEIKKYLSDSDYNLLKSHIERNLKFKKQPGITIDEDLTL